MNNTYSDPGFYRPFLMGPNCLKIAGELCDKAPFPEGARILDLGSGMGLTSMFLADACKATVFAADLWIDPTDNYGRFESRGFADRVIPLRAEARALPFARGYFDAVASIDAYHYFGADAVYLSEHLLPLVKKGGLIAVGVPGLKQEFSDGIPRELRPFWQDDMHFHSAAWWRDLWTFAGGPEILFCGDLQCHDEAWKDWLACDNPYAVGDREMMTAEGGRYFSTVGMIARV